MNALLGIDMMEKLSEGNIGKCLFAQGILLQISDILY